MIKSQRKIAYEVLLKIERGAYANLCLKEALSKSELTAEHKRFISALVYTCLDNLIYIDYIIGEYAKGRVAPAVKCALRIGVCQLLYMNVPDSACCDETVKLMKQIGKGALSGFANGVMRSITRSKDTLAPIRGDELTQLSIKYSYPIWLLKCFIDSIGILETKALLEYNPKRLTTIRANKFKSSKEEYLAHLDKLEMSYDIGAICSDAIELKLQNIADDSFFKEGKIAVQGQSSMLVCKVAEPKKGMSVLDACSAPGGKAMYIAELMGEGRISAWDIHPHRVELIEKNAQRLGIDFIKCEVRDASKYEVEFEQAFDLVLTDVPCSGLGTLSGKPDIKYSKSEKAIEELSAIQKSILNTCSNYVKKGGMLIYSTCTISKAENDGVIDWFLAQNSDFYQAEICDYVPEKLKERTNGGRIQLLPHIDETDGFYICKLVRR